MNKNDIAEVLNFYGEPTGKKVKILSIVPGLAGHGNINPDNICKVQDLATGREFSIEERRLLPVNKYYLVEIVYEGDEISNYISQILVKANNEDEALVKAENRFNRKELGNYIRSSVIETYNTKEEYITKYPNNNTDIVESILLNSKMSISKIKKLNEELNRLLEDEEITYNWVHNLDSKDYWNDDKGKGGFKTIEEAKQNLLDYIQDNSEEDYTISWYDPEDGGYYSDEPIFKDYGENGILSLSFEWKTYEAEDTETYYIVPEGYVTEVEKQGDKIREFDSKYRKLRYDINEKIYALFEPFDFLSLTQHSGDGPIIEMYKQNSSGKIIYLWFYTDASSRHMGVENRISAEDYIKYDEGTNRNIIKFLKDLTSLNYNADIFYVKKIYRRGL